MVVPFYISYLCEILFTVVTILPYFLELSQRDQFQKTEDGLHPAVSSIQPRFNLYIKTF